MFNFVFHWCKITLDSLSYFNVVVNVFVHLRWTLSKTYRKIMVALSTQLKTYISNVTTSKYFIIIIWGSALTQHGGELLWQIVDTMWV